MKKNSSKTILFYTLLLSYITETVDDEQLRRAIIEIASKAGVSWEVTHESIEELEVCVNRPSEVNDDDHSFGVRYDHLVAAFRDLSPIKNPAAIELFHRIGERLDPSYGSEKDHVVWAKSMTCRPDGSGIIVLHVSDMVAARKFFEEHQDIDSSQSNPTLETGILFAVG